MILCAAQLPVLALWLVITVSSSDTIALTIQYKVLEEEPSGTMIGTLADDLKVRGETGVLDNFQIVKQALPLPFVVGLQDGMVLTKGQLDRETLCRDTGLCLIAFNVLFNTGGAIGFLQVNVEVLDINDHSPTFPSAEQEIEISETAMLRMRIPLDRALDPDAGPNGLQTYSLSPNQHFALDVITHSDGTKHAELVVIKELDREVQSSFELTLVAWDKGNPPRSGSTLVKINVLDSNDNSPVFEESLLAIDLSEDTVRGTTVINLKATDPDQGANGEIEYSFSKHAPLEVQNLFSIDPKTGTVNLTGELDYENKHTYEIDIQARDLGPNAIPSHCKLHIKVLDVNDNAPNIHFTWAPQDSAFATVSEGAAKETFLALVMVSDADSGSNGEVHCHIQHGLGHFRLKKVHRDNYMIVTNSVLDRESRVEYNLTLVAKDHGIPPLSVTKHLTVHVLDENDNPPVFSKVLYEASFEENNEPDYLILSVDAHDVDLDLNGKISYSIKESKDSDKFIIHPTTGYIHARQSFDFELFKSFTLIVEAADQGQPSLTSSATVLINIKDINDNFPIIEEPVSKRGRASITIPVNTEKGEIFIELGDIQGDRSSTYLFEYPSSNNSTAGLKPFGYLATKIRAHDMDSGLNGMLHYKIIKGNTDGLFLLDQLTGEMYVNSSNATELIGKVFEIDIAVSDLGSPPLVTEANLEITFINLLDHQKNSSPGQRGQLSSTMMLAICLGATFLLLLVVVALVTTFCRMEKRDNRAYNCRQAESTYTRHPRRPQKQIQKTDIQLIPVLRGRKEEALEEDPQKTSIPKEEEIPETQAFFPPCQFNLSPSLSRTLRNQTFPDNNGTLPLHPPRTLRKPSNIEIDGSLPRTPATPYRTLRRTKNSEVQAEAPASPTPSSRLGTLRRQGSPEIQQSSEGTSDSAPSSPPFRTLRRQRNVDCKMKEDKEDHQQILRNLVRMSMAAFAEYSPIELSSASPEVQQISQLLSLLHQGQLQPRPNFRGNKYSHRAGRSGTQDTDWLSTKDSGHGESEAGDVDWDIGRDSPIDPLLGEGLDMLLSNTDDVFADAPDPAWMARLSLPLSADYRENVFVPEGHSSPETLLSPQALQEATTCFSTFGKTSGKGSALPGHLFSEVSTLFEMLLTQKADSQPQTSAEMLYRLSAAYRRSLGLDGTGGGAQQPRSPAAENNSHATYSSGMGLENHY
ncbi:protocadherin-12 [Lepisosteus oculatus]|uniref:protocadherin-12 n=1 Tax=Lepisosteus oculatus TaxID=7918 RepID=UPI0035F506BE